MSTETLNKSTETQTERFATPRTNIRGDEHGYVIEAELPGVSRDRLSVSVENQELVIVGRRADEVLPGDAVYRELSPRNYRRVFDLDPAIDVAAISAHLEQGLLRLTLPKLEAVKPRKIEVTS